MGVDKCIVVSDAAPAAGLPPGKYRQLGGEVYEAARPQSTQD